MTDLPLVTVVTPCYNSGRFLRETIESALDQGTDCEVIVVDDGSTDDTLAVAQSSCQCRRSRSRPAVDSHGSLAGTGLAILPPHDGSRRRKLRSRSR